MSLAEEKGCLCSGPQGLEGCDRKARREREKREEGILPFSASTGRMMGTSLVAFLHQCMRHSAIRLLGRLHQEEDAIVRVSSILHSGASAEMFPLDSFGFVVVTC